MQMKKPILVIGPIFCDLLLSGYERMPEAGQELYLPDYTISLGGNAIVASALTQLDIPTSLLTTIGDDLMAEHLLALLREKGIREEHVIPLPGMKSNISCVFAHDGERSFLTWAQPRDTCNTAMARHAASLDPSLFSHIHLSFELLHIPEIQHFVQRAKERGTTVSTDLGFQDALRWEEEHFALLQAVDFFFPNLEEARLITGASELNEMLHRLRRWVAEPIITLGEKGVASLMKDQGIVFCPAPTVEGICNTTGAGDSFVAGFLFGRFHGMDLYESLRIGVATGSLTVGSEQSVSPDISRARLQQMGVLDGYSAVRERAEG